MAEAFALNSPLIAVPAGGHGAADFGLVANEGLPLALGALKPAEEGKGLILRLYQPHGARGTATLRFGRAVRRVEAVDLLEEPAPGTAPALEQDGAVVRFAVRPFQVVTLRVELA